MQLSNSKMKTWRSCHYKYYLKYAKKLSRKYKSAPLVRGSIIHECLEAYNSGKSWVKVYKQFEKEFYENAFTEEIEKLGDIPKMVKELMENYTHYYEDDGVEYLHNELYFELPLVKGVELIGYIDAVVQDEQGTWGQETKTYSRDPDRDFLMFNTQSSIYAWACKEMGIPVKGTMWNIIKAKEPSRPVLTQKGVLSKAAMDSTPYTVKKGLIELGLDPKEYQDFINSFSFDGFFYRPKFRVNKNVMESIMEDTRDTARDILKNGGVLKDKNLGLDCKMCDYKSICQAELMGIDPKYIIKQDYEIKEKDNGEKGKKPSSIKNKK